MINTARRTPAAGIFIRGLLGLAACVTLGAIPASAGFTVLTPNVQVLTPPFSPSLNLQQDQTESDTMVRAFNEQTRFTSNQAITVDFNSPGAYTVFNLPSPKPVIASGSTFATDFFHVDPVAHNLVDYVFSVRFDADIIGVQILTSTREAGDLIVGRGDVIYPTTGSGLEDPIDLVIEFMDQRTILVNLFAGPGQDNFRVFTAPEPSSIALAFTGLATLSGLGLRRRLRGKPA